MITGAQIFRWARQTRHKYAEKLTKHVKQRLKCNSWERGEIALEKDTSVWKVVTGVGPFLLSFKPWLPQANRLICDRQSILSSRFNAMR